MGRENACRFDSHQAKAKHKSSKTLDFGMESTIESTIVHSDDNMSQAKLNLEGAAADFEDFRDDLARNGYAVLKGAVPQDRAKIYGDKFFQYLEDL